jgi:integrase
MRGGKRQRRYVYGRTRREVQEKLTALRRAHDAGLLVAPEKQTVGQFLERWLADVARTSLRPTTYSSYGWLIARHISPELGHLPLAKLSPQDVQTYINHKRAEGLSARTVQYLHAVLRRALGQAVKWELVDAPRVRRVEVQPLSPDEARAFLAFMRGDRLEALYSVGLALGLRRGEVVWLRWQDVGLQHGVLSVRGALQRIDGTLQRIDGTLQWVDGTLQWVEVKTDRSRRTIALPDVVLAALRAHRARQLEERLAAGELWQDTGYVFVQPNGAPIGGRLALKYFQPARASAGLPWQRFHDLRHACASLLLVQGVPMRVVMEILGHTRISTTADLYSHVLPELQREAANRMNDLLANAP